MGNIKHKQKSTNLYIIFKNAALIATEICLYKAKDFVTANAAFYCMKNVTLATVLLSVLVEVSVAATLINRIICIPVRYP